MKVYFMSNNKRVHPNCPLNKATEPVHCFGRGLLHKCPFFGNFYHDAPNYIYVTCNYFKTDGQLSLFD